MSTFGFAGVKACGAAFCLYVDVFIGRASGVTGEGKGAAAQRSLCMPTATVPPRPPRGGGCVVLCALDPKQSKCMWTRDYACSCSTHTPSALGLCVSGFC